VTDVHDAAARSRNMRAIRSKNTAPELAVRGILHRAGFRFRLHGQMLPGHPDIVLKKYRAVIFVHGCFWHGHGCSLFKVPKTRTSFWLAKIGANVERDISNVISLHSSGWRILTIWECALKGNDKLAPELLSATVVNWLRSESDCDEIAGHPSVQGLHASDVLSGARS
jgi:DNA mismatch endonuclease (patch repair protein)